MVRAVLDTNVVVSAYLVPSGKPASIISLARQGDVEICLSADMLGEIQRTLLRPKLQRIHKARPDEIDRFLKAFAEIAVITPGMVEVIRSRVTRTTLRFWPAQLKVRPIT